VSEERVAKARAVVHVSFPCGPVACADCNAALDAFEAAVREDERHRLIANDSAGKE
jgi:hypothetical protein